METKKTKPCCSVKVGRGTVLRLWISALSLVVGFSISQFSIHFPMFPYSDPSWIAVFLCSGPIFGAAFKGLFSEKKINSAMLVSLAMIASFSLQIMEIFGIGVSTGHCHSYIFVVGEIAFLMALGSWLEERTLAKTNEGLEKLSNLMPKTAFVLKDGKAVEIPAADISEGDIICVKPDEMIAADGLIIKGSTSVDQSNMTGESVPVDKAEGESVLCGTYNVGSYVEVRAAKAPDASVLSRLIELVEEAEGRRAPISRLANKWASYIVPAAIISSVLVFFVAYLFFEVGFAESIVRGVTILVVFCPCAFVLATPTAVSAGIGNAARNGILVRSGAVLEKLSKITSVFFDKTGTLTNGKISVESFECIDAGEYPDIALAVAALESRCVHPLARAAAEYALAKCAGETIPEVSEFKSETGRGVSGMVEGRFFEIRKAENPDFASSVSEVYKDGVLVAKIRFSDELRESAREAVSELKGDSLKVSILSGDNFAAAKYIADCAGIADVRANLFPQGKLDTIRNAQAAGERVCMVGDGVNDAPSLAAADVSIAMASLKNDIAIGTAQIALLGGDLRKIPAAFKFSQRVMHTISANIVFSLAVNFASIVLALFGIITPGIGALIHNASSVAVVANSARLLGSKKLYSMREK